jgi:hypothetical protein
MEQALKNVPDAEFPVPLSAPQFAPWNGRYAVTGSP